jgi:hypothetical protein
MRGWVCRLRSLLVLASAVILGSDCRGIHDHILRSQIEDFPNLEGQFPVFICPRDRVSLLYPQALGSCPSPLKTRRATVQVFDPATTRVDINRVRVRVTVTLRVAVYRQSICLGDKPLETHDQQFYFPNEHLGL